MRNILNIAIVKMVYKASHNSTIYDNTCPSSDGKPTAEQLGFEWSEQLQGVILGAFYWGYVSFMSFFIQDFKNSMYFSQQHTFQVVCWRPSLVESMC